MRICISSKGQKVKAKMVHGTANLAKRRFHGLMRPMKLKASVRMIKKTSSTPPCMIEMSAMMACWKENTFEDGPCRKEIKAFVECAEKARLNPQEFNKTKDSGWPTDEVNARLRRFVWEQ